MTTFYNLGIQPNLIKGLAEINIKIPNEVQLEVLPILLNSTLDIVVQAPTGTGKTAAFGIPLLDKIKPKKKEIQGLILCPTRELGQQIAQQLFKFTKYTEKIFVEAIGGGVPIGRQMRALARPTHILVATPGRLQELIERRAVNLSSVHKVVLDEADEMLRMGFKEDIDKILTKVNAQRKVWLFSATIPQGIKEIINKNLEKNAVKIRVDVKNEINKNISHKYLKCDISEKQNELLKFIKSQKEKRGVVFCKTKADADKIAQFLRSNNITSLAIHGDLLQKDRDKVMRFFKKEKIQILVATDMSARGIDVVELAFVVHYHLPEMLEYYIHRSGRTARAGNKGLSLCIITNREINKIQDIEQKLKIVFKVHSN